MKIAKHILAATLLCALLPGISVSQDLRSPPEGMAERAQPASVRPVPIRLGMVSPLTGDFARYGEHIMRGIRLAQDHLRERNIPTEIFYEDACLPKEVRSAVAKLISGDKIEGLVASYCVVGLIPSAPLLEQAHIVSFHTSVVPQALLDSSDFIFSTNARIGDEGRKLAEYAFNEMNMRKAAVLYLTTQWGEEYKRYFVKRFTELGGKITGVETNPIGVNDFRTELTRLKSGDPEVLLLVHVGATLATSLKQARSLGLSQEILTVNEAEEEEIVTSAAGNAEGMRFFAPEPSSRTDAMGRFEGAFVEKFKRPPHPLSRHSYDATMLVATALSSCARDPECAQKRLLETKNYQGATGEISIQRDGGTEREFVMKSVRDGEFARVDGR